jgi:single-stranded-DNA-specific exonuclease
MASHAPSVFGIERSLTGRAWRWRRGNMDLGSGDGLESNLIDQLLLARGVPADDLPRHRTPSLREFLPDPSEFRDMDAAAERLAQAVLTNETVTIYGDYDVDGATSAALLIRLLRMLGHDAGYYIPDRLLEGYGPSGEALVRLAEQGSSLIVTVDCGAMAHEALAMAHDAGVDVIVVDHHKCASELPIAAALVNPNRLDEGDIGAAHGHLAAVGVAFLLAVATVRRLRGTGYFETRREPDLFALLDLVALGTVADVAQLKGLNRAMVAQGLKVMARRDNIGMSALIDASRLKRAPTCSDLGFALGPRINAGGRVGESTLGVRLLTTEDAEEARTIAAQLSTLNEERRAIEQAVQEAAEAQLAGQHNRAVIVLSGHGWHPGVIGIVAGRIKEKTGKPTLVIALDDGGAAGKGSGRSIPGIDLGAAVIAAREAGLLGFARAHTAGVVAGLFLLYVGVTASSLPAATALTFLAAWLFRRLFEPVGGFVAAVALVSFASAAGATLAFLFSRHLLRDALHARYGDRLVRFDEALRRDGPFYLFTLRLTPVVPFWLVNLAMGLTPLRTRTFWWVSQVGMLPATCVFVFAGHQVPSLAELDDGGVWEMLWPGPVLALLLLAVFPWVARWLAERLRGAAGRVC